MINTIKTGLFELYKIGPGPSSSHTIAPMRAAGDFLRQIERRYPSGIRGRIEVELFGSLALTGPGHGTARAIAAGLLGAHPEDCDTNWLNALFRNPSRRFRAAVSGSSLDFTASDIRFSTEAPEQGNVMRLALLDLSGRELFAERYFSPGGGFVRREGESDRVLPDPPYPYCDFLSFRTLAEAAGLSPEALLSANETALTGRSKEEIRGRLQEILDVMHDAVRRGLEARGELPGPLHLARRAGEIFDAARRESDSASRMILFLDAFSIAGAEENAAGGRVVTAPTSGSAGILPGMIEYLRRFHGIREAKLRDGLLLAGVIGFVAQHNGSISGADVGCQGEIGVAAAMAAGLAVAALGGNLRQVEAAAETALEHHLGLSCDPVGGYVQIPCIERNAAGTVAAWNACRLALCDDFRRRKVSFDAVLTAMVQTGRGMDAAFKETARGGLALCIPCF